MGDLLIWNTILELGKLRKMWFSIQTKPDWYHKSNKQPLYPRFELLTEFQNVSDKHAFHIIKFSELLKLMGAEENIVNEVATEETASEIIDAESLTPSEIRDLILSTYQNRAGVSCYFRRNCGSPGLFS